MDPWSPVNLNRKRKAPILGCMSIHWLTRLIFILFVALGMTTSGTGRVSLLPTPTAGLASAMSMDIKTDMPADQVTTGPLGSDQGLPCKDMPLNCVGGLSCVMCVALPETLFSVRSAERTEKRDWSFRIDPSGLSIPPAIPPPIAAV